MPTSYTSLLKLALPATGELSGTWGDVVNNNVTSMVEQAIAGKATISTWLVGVHTLSTANGTTSEARCAILECSGAPGMSAYLICPTSTKFYIIRNNVAGGYTVTLKTASGSGVIIPNGSAMLLYCDGTNVIAGVDYVTSAYSAFTATTAGTATSATSATSATTTNGVVYVNGTGALANGSGLVYDGTNLGVGTSSPAYKLDVAGTAANTISGVRDTTGYALFRAANSGAITFFGTDNSTGAGTGTANASMVWGNSNVPLVFGTNNTEKMRLDASGNLGLGVIPSAWSAGQGFEVKNGGAISAKGASLDIASNAFFGASGWTYTTSSTAGRYAQVSGQHQWCSAPSGTAGTAITFTQAMTLDANGKLGLGVTSPGYTIDATAPSSGDTGIRLTKNGAVNTTINAVTGGLTFGVDGSGGATERMRLDSSGNVGIGTTSPGSKLDVKGTLRLSGATSGYVGLAPAAAAGSTTYTLPAADGSSGQVLSTNGTGTLSWATGAGGSVTSVSVVSANGLAGTVANPSTTPAITLSTSVTGVLKGNGTAISTASAGTDYVAPGAVTADGITMSTARILGRTTAATGAVEEIAVGSGLSLSAGTLSSTLAGGSVTTVSVVSANGLAGTVANASTTPAITLSTSITGVLKGNGTAISAATSGTDYLAPPSGTALLKANSGGALANATAGTDYVAPGGALGTPSSGTLTNATGLPLTTGVTGILPIANGGNNSSATPTAGGIHYGTGTAYSVTAAGTTGQVLISNGASAPSWGTAVAGTDVNVLATSQITLASSLGTFASTQAISLDSTHDLILMSGSGSLHAVVCDTSAGTFGTAVLVRTGAVSDNYIGYGVSASQVLVCSAITTAYQAVVLSVSGTTITVNTSAPVTLGGNINVFCGEMIACGSTYVCAYLRATTTAGLLAHTISGTTVTIGSEVTASSGTASAISPILWSLSASSFLAIFVSSGSTSLIAKPGTVSGATITGGTEATTAITATSGLTSCQLSTGRILTAYTNTQEYAAVIGVAANVATISSVQISTAAGGTVYRSINPIGSGKAIIVLSQSLGLAAVVTDIAGFASVGTTNQLSNLVYFVKYDSTSTWVYDAGNGGVIKVSASGANASIALVASNGGNTYTFNQFSTIPAKKPLALTSMQGTTFSVGTTATAFNNVTNAIAAVPQFYYLNTFSKGRISDDVTWQSGYNSSFNQSIQLMKVQAL